MSVITSLPMLIHCFGSLGKLGIEGGLIVLLDGIVAVLPTYAVVDKLLED